MNWLAREFGRAAVRRLAYIVVVALLGLASAWWNTAAAQGYYASAGAAWNACMAEVAASPPGSYSNQYPTTSCKDYPAGTLNQTHSYIASERYHYQTGAYFSYRSLFEYPNGSTFCPTGAPLDPENPGQCLDEDKCLARNSSLGNSTGTRAFTSNTNTTSCVGGCMMDFSGQTSPVRKGKMWNAQGLEVERYFVSGEYKYNGQMCGADYTAGTPEQQNTKVETEESAKPKKEECVPVGGQTVCRKSDGKLCPSGSANRELCWNPHELGTKTDGDFLQTKKPGTSNGAESIALSSGDTATKTNDVRIREETTQNGQTRVSDSVISTYKTVSGADAGAANQGTPTTESGQPGAEDGEGDEDGNGSSGGGDCDTPPVSTGDEILAQIARQTWETRCQSERQDKALNKYAADLEGQTASEPNDGDAWQDSEGETNGDILSAASSVVYGGGCPAPPAVQFGDQVFQWPNGFCDALAAIRLLLIGVAMFWGLRIITGRNS